MKLSISLCRNFISLAPAVSSKINVANPCRMLILVLIFGVVLVRNHIVQMRVVSCPALFARYDKLLVRHILSRRSVLIVVAFLLVESKLFMRSQSSISIRHNFRWLTFS